jgi:hypothetical protein
MPGNSLSDEIVYRQNQTNSGFARRCTKKTSAKAGLKFHVAVAALREVQCVGKSCARANDIDQYV